MISNALKNRLTSMAILVLTLAACGSGDDTPRDNRSQAVTIAQASSDSDVAAPAVMTDTSGVRHVFWNVRLDPSHWQTQHSVYNKDSGWSPAMAVTGSAGYYPDWTEGMDIFDAGQGRILVAWTADNASTWGRDIYINSYAPESGWSAPVQVRSSENTIRKVKIVADGEGKRTLVWIEREFATGGYYNLWGSQQTSVGDTWQPAQLLENALYDCEQLNAGITPAGTVTALWRQGGAIHTISLANNTWSDIQQLANGGEALNTAFSANGNIIAAWNAVVDSVPSILAKRSTATDGWSGNEVLTPATMTLAQRSAINVAINDSGDALVQWHTSLDQFIPTVIARYVALSGWQMPVETESDTFFEEVRTLTLDGQNHGYYVRQKANKALLAFVYDGDQWQPGKEIYNAGANDILTPQLAMDKNRNGVVAWREIVANNGGYAIKVIVIDGQ